MKRRIAAWAASIGLITSGIVFGAAPSASAVNWGCPGSQVGSYAISYGGETISRVYVFYSSASNGTNCVVNTAVKYAGHAYEMDVYIQPSGSIRYATDGGNYSSYAGPVKLTGMDGHCLDVDASAANSPRGAYGEVIYTGHWHGIHCG
ncbi:hypothetical protein [Streptomyces sp. NPDC059651]|uniref:hypothetical protein n=1 Tax=unclassified Streptomyces TaxID=2593676 RepID=UPI0036C0B9AA